MTAKIKIQLEYTLNCSPPLLFTRLSSPSGLAEWFADDVKTNGKKYIFNWSGSTETAELTLIKENKLVRFSWTDSENTYFEFRISQDELTGDVSLVVIDFADQDEMDEMVGYWNNHISNLKHVIGA